MGFLGSTIFYLPFQHCGFYMSDQTKEEKREFVRASLNIDARVKPLDKEGVDRKHHMRSAFSSLPLPGGLPDDSDQIGTQDTVISYLMEFMFQINEKLDIVIDLMGGEKSNQNTIEVQETVNISGSGVSLVVSTSVDVGLLLDISLFIANFPLGVFNVQGEVIRVKPKRGDNSGLYEIGIKFLNISDEERERLIAYTFRQQRRTIRDIKEYD
jgi:hypothetical protein